MIQIQQLNLKIPHMPDAVRQKALKTLHVRESDVVSFKIAGRSLDARKKPELFYVYTAELCVKNEASVRRNIKNKNIRFVKKEKPYRAVLSGDIPLKKRPVIIGTGPAGLFCGYQLARLGYRPILLERGKNVRQRMLDVENFWKGGALNKNSNVQFGEGGAGTFSDGKLNTLVHGSGGRHEEVLNIFHQFGAPEEILYDSKPHIGTDILCRIVENMRESILSYGGEVRFGSLAEGFELTQVDGGGKALSAVLVHDMEAGRHYRLETQAAVLAVGHSARDTFEVLERLGVEMVRKSFAVGLRIEHPQRFINKRQYGMEDASLPAASYKLTARAADGRGVYTFCMCPGGYVVNASSEEGRTAVNGMSYSKRDGENANSAVIVTVTPDDYGAHGPLSGIEFQQRLEERAYELGGKKIPVQRFDDFCANRSTTKLGDVLPQMKGAYRLANVRSIFAEELAGSLQEGILAMDKKIHGFARPDAVLSGVESRTSSPVRVLRDENMESGVEGVYPCGEGAGYAGGITSAAMDGMKVAEAILRADSRAT